MAKTEIKTEKLEREYIIPLRKKTQIVPRYKKTNKAVKTVKEFLARHMKIRDRDLNKIKINRYLNEALWARGIKNPPLRIKVKAIKEGEIVRVELVDFSNKLKFKKLREEKQEEKGKISCEKKKNLIQKTQEMKAKSDEEETSEKIKDAEKEKQESVEEDDEKIAKQESRKKDKTASPQKELKMKKSIKKKQAK